MTNESEELMSFLKKFQKSIEEKIEDTKEKVEETNKKNWDETRQNRHRNGECEQQDRLQ